MVNRNKILSDLSKFAVDAMSTFSGLKDEIETIVSISSFSPENALIASTANFDKSDKILFLLTIFLIII